MEIMKNLFCFCAFFLLLFTQPVQSQPSDSNMEKLNEIQKQYFEWTERNFAPLLQADDYSDLSEAAKEELGRHYQKLLQDLLGYITTGGGYKEQDAQKWKAINTLAALKYQSAVKELLQIATENVPKDNRERWMAVRALRFLGDASVIPNLIPLIYHSNPNSRLWAQIALVQLSGENFGYDWKAWAEWWNATGKEPQCSLDFVQWTLPPSADVQWNDPEFQQKKDLENYQKMTQPKAEPNAAPAEKTSSVKIDIPPRDPAAAVTLLDLTNYYNHGLKGSWIPMQRWPQEIQKLNYDLSSLPAGIQTLDGIPFDIRGVIQLTSQTMKEFGGVYPEKVEGIPVQLRFRKLYAINSNLWGAGAPNGDVVAHFVLHYDDGTQQNLDMVSGVHTQDWWYYISVENKTQAKTVWKGTNEFVNSDFIKRQFGEIELQLFKAAWENPCPEKKVTCLDFVSNMGMAAPFLTAITVE
jgi:hypothetical protein